MSGFGFAVVDDSQMRASWFLRFKDKGVDDVGGCYSCDDVASDC